MRNCIVTGLGGRGLNWLNKLQARDDCRAIAFVEPFEANRQRAVSQQGLQEAQIFATLDEAIASTREADFVLDVTPPAVHHEIAEKAFANGLHLLGEKPLSDNFANAKRIAELGEVRGLRHMITQNYRFGAQPRTSRRVLAEDIIGAPGQCDIRFYMPWADMPNSHYVTEPFMLINDMMVHHFDLMRYVLNRDPQSVQAITWNQPWGWHKGDASHAIVFRYDDGLVATHVTCGCDVGWQTSWNGDWHIAGPNGSLDWDTEGTWYSHRHRTENAVNRQAVPHDEVAEPEQAILTEFLSALEEDREPECSANDNLKSLTMVFAAIQSARENRVVQLSEVQ